MCHILMQPQWCSSSLKCVIGRVILLFLGASSLFWFFSYNGSFGAHFDVWLPGLHSVCACAVLGRTDSHWCFLFVFVVLTPLAWPHSHRETIAGCMISRSCILQSLLWTYHRMVTLSSDYEVMRSDVGDSFSPFLLCFESATLIEVLIKRPCRAMPHESVNNLSKSKSW